VIANVTVGPYPTYTLAAAFDPNNGDIYVANALCCQALDAAGSPGSVAVVSGSNDTLIASITGAGATPSSPTGFDPDGITFDPTNGDIYIAAPDEVVVISASTNTVIDAVPLGTASEGLAYDSFNGDVYVANLHANTTSVISGSTNTLVATLPTGVHPDGIAFDSSNGDVYVADETTGSVSVIAPNTATKTTETTVPEFPNYVLLTTLVLSMAVVASYSRLANQRANAYASSGKNAGIHHV